VKKRAQKVPKVNIQEGKMKEVKVAAAAVEIVCEALNGNVRYLYKAR